MFHAYIRYEREANTNCSGSCFSFSICDSCFFWF